MSFVFVAFEGGRFFVTEEARQFLLSPKMRDKKVAVVVLAGPYRHGKSTLLNRFVLQNPPSTGFDVGQSINACTKGLHMSTKLLPNSSEPDAVTLVIDTEGLGATTANQTHDTNIFALALLCSSLFMYNSKGTIDQSSIDTLALVARIVNEFRRQMAYDGSGSANANNIASATASSKNKRAKTEPASLSTSVLDSDQKAEHDEQFAKLFPTFMWIVRDFVLDLVAPDGKTTITAAQYLENALVPIEGGDADKNEVRRALRTLFRTRDCLVMARPSSDDHVLKTLNNQPDSAFDAKFVEQAARLRDKIQQYAKVKRLDTHTLMTGSLLLQLTEQYCAAFNEQRMPVIRDAWIHISRERCQAAMKEALDLFIHEMSSSVYETHSKLESFISAGFDKSLELFRNRATEDSATALQDLRKALNKQAGELRMQLTSRLVDNANAILRTIDTHVDSLKSVEQLVVLVQTKHNEFTERYGRDPQTQSAWNQECIGKQLLWAQKIASGLNEHLVQAQRELKEQQQQNMQLTSDLSKKTEVDKENERLRLLMEELTCELSHLKKHMEDIKPLADKAHALQAANQELEQRVSEAEYTKSQTDQLQSQLTVLTVENQRSADMVNQLQQSKDALDKKLAKVQKDLASLVETHQIEIQSLQQQTQQTLQQIRNSKDAAIQRANAANAENEANKAQVAKLQADLEKTKSQNQTQSLQTIQQLKSDHQLVVQRLEASKQEMAADFQRKLADLKAESLAARQQRDAENRQKYQELMAEKTLLEGRHQTLTAEANSLKQQFTNKCDELANVRSELRSTASNVTTLQTQIAAVTARLEMRDRAFADQVVVMTSQGDRLAAAEEELQQIRQQHQAEQLTMRLSYESRISQLEDKCNM